MLSIIISVWFGYGCMPSNFNILRLWTERTMQGSGSNSDYGHLDYTMSKIKREKLGSTSLVCRGKENYV